MQCSEIFATINGVTMCMSNAHLEYDGNTEVSIVKNDTDLISVTQDFINIECSSFSEGDNTVTCKCSSGTVIIDLKVIAEPEDEDDEKEEKKKGNEEDDDEEIEADDEEEKEDKTEKE